MKKNLYVRSVYQSTRAIDATVAGLALGILSFPRTLLEVFIRTNLGERYFSFANALSMFIILAYIPYGYRFELENFALALKLITASSDIRNVIMNTRNYYEFDWGNFFLHNATWYLFLVAFFYQCIKRQNEIKRLPSVFDFGRCSVDSGRIHPFFETFRWKGRGFELREIETILEPLFFFLISVVLILLKQNIGYLILMSSFCYWYYYRIAYHQGDHFVMDWIDGQIFSQQLDNAFVQNKNPWEAKGVNYRGRKPSDPSARSDMADDIQDTDYVEVS